MRRGPEAVKAWCIKNKVSANALGKRIGSLDGQAAKWINGKRTTAPIKYKVRIARETGLRLDVVVDSDELETARELFAVFARDCTGRGAAA